MTAPSFAVSRLTILAHPDPGLRRRATAVDVFDASLGRFIDDLCDTLRASGGIGLAAPQVGVAHRVLVMDLSGGVEPPEVYVNPEILQAAVPGLVEESCLSVPGVVGNVVRATRLRVRARDRHGEVFETDLEDMRAVCLQHELDHLEGRLFVDRLSWWRRLQWQARAALQGRLRAA